MQTTPQEFYGLKLSIEELIFFHLRKLCDRYIQLGNHLMAFPFSFLCGVLHFDHASAYILRIHFLIELSNRVLRPSFPYM
jgi:hypothetical protein